MSPTDDPDPRVRPANPTDADRLRALQSHLRQPSPELLRYGRIAGTVLVSVAGERGADTGSASNPDDPVGYLLPVDAPGRPGCHLAELVVDPAFRREGRARALLTVVLRDADGPATLQAHPDNDAARSLYESMGFDVVDRRPNAYADADALVFRHE